MLEMFRNAGKSWVAKILLLLLAGSFGVWGIQDIFGGFRATALATVGDQEISDQEFSRSLNQTLQNIAQQQGQALTLEDARKMGLDRTVLNNLVRSAALDAQASKLKLNISAATIAEDARTNPVFQDSTGKFDPVKFGNILKLNGLNEQIYVASEVRNRLRSAITGSVQRGMKPPNTLVEALYRYRTEQRDARYFTVAASEADVAPPTDDELKKQYEATPAAYTAPEYRSIAVLKVEPADLASRISVTSEELTAGYEKYKLDYFAPEKRTILQLSFPSVDEARKAKERIAAGTDFMAIAKERGATDADITFADKTRKDFLDKTIAEAAFALKEGEVSDVVSGSLVTALLKATKVTAENQPTLEDVKDKLTQRLQGEKALEEIQTIYDTVENARNSQTKFEDIAKEQSLPFILIPTASAAGLDPSGKEVDLAQKQVVLKEAYQSDVGVENEALTPGDSYFWYEVREVIPSKLKPLEAVKEQVRGDVVARKVRDTLRERAEKLAKSLETGMAMETAALEAKATIKTAQGLKRAEASADFDGPAITALFSVPENGFTWSLESDGKTAKIMQSMAVLGTTLDLKSPEAVELTKTLSAAASNDILQTYLAALQDQVGASINETLWQKLSGTSAALP